MNPYPIDKKFESFGFNVLVIDGHNFDEILDAFAKARETKGKPTAIIAKTRKGKGTEASIPLGPVSSPSVPKC